MTDQKLETLTCVVEKFIEGLTREDLEHIAFYELFARSADAPKEEVDNLMLDPEKQMEDFFSNLFDDLEQGK